MIKLVLLQLSGLQVSQKKAFPQKKKKKSTFSFMKILSSCFDWIPDFPHAQHPQILKPITYTLSF